MHSVPHARPLVLAHVGAHRRLGHLTGWATILRAVRDLAPVVEIHVQLPESDLHVLDPGLPQRKRPGG